MIVNVPDAEAFQNVSRNLLNLAWEIGIESLHNFEEARDTLTMNESYGEVTQFNVAQDAVTPPVGIDEDQQQAELAFWERSQPSMQNALALIQQATEMALKGRIAAVSPYLLIIARDARDYPSVSATKDVQFSAFRSIDAADLFRVHNSVCADRLPDQVRLYAAGVLELVLWVNDSFYFPSSWIKTRLELRGREYHEMMKMLGEDSGHNYGATLREFDTAIRNMSPALVKTSLGFNTRQRGYVCPRCYSRSDREMWWDDQIWRFAQFRPKVARATNLTCAFCKETVPVLRRKCSEDDCPSDVLSNDDDSLGLCLLHLHRNEL